jgi:hypothetical protein
VNHDDFLYVEFFRPVPAPVAAVKREKFPEKPSMINCHQLKKAERETERRWARRERAMPNREMELRRYVHRSKVHIGTYSNMT